MSTLHNIDLKNYSTNNTSKFDFEGKDFIIFPEPRYFISFFIPPLIYGSGFINEDNCTNKDIFFIDNRYKVIMQSTINFLYLNPSISPTELYRVMIMLNCKCINPINDMFLEKMHEEVLKLQKQNKLTPYANLKRTYLVNPILTDKARRSIVGMVNGELKKQKTLAKLENAITNWRHGKYSNKKLASIVELSVKQIEKYTPLLTKQIKELKKKKPAPKGNKTLQKLKSILVKWDVKNGLPTNAKLAEITGLSLDTIKRYSPQLKTLKAHLKEKQKKRTKKHPFFAPFNAINFENDEVEHEISIIAEKAQVTHL